MNKERERLLQGRFFPRLRPRFSASGESTPPPSEGGGASEATPSRKVGERTEYHELPPSQKLIADTIHRSVLARSEAEESVIHLKDAQEGTSHNVYFFRVFGESFNQDLRKETDPAKRFEYFFGCLRSLSMLMEEERAQHTAKGEEADLYLCFTLDELEHLFFDVTNNQKGAELLSTYFTFASTLGFHVTHPAFFKTDNGQPPPNGPMIAYLSGSALDHMDWERMESVTEQFANKDRLPGHVALFRVRPDLALSEARPERASSLHEHIACGAKSNLGYFFVVAAAEKRFDMRSPENVSQTIQTLTSLFEFLQDLSLEHGGREAWRSRWGAHYLPALIARARDITQKLAPAIQEHAPLEKQYLIKSAFAEGVWSAVRDDFMRERFTPESLREVGRAYTALDSQGQGDVHGVVRLHYTVDQRGSHLSLHVNPSYGFTIPAITESFLVALESAAVLAEHDPSIKGLTGTSWQVKERIMDLFGFKVAGYHAHMSRVKLLTRPWRKNLEPIKAKAKSLERVRQGHINKLLAGKPEVPGFLAPSGLDGRALRAVQHGVSEGWSKNLNQEEHTLPTHAFRLNIKGATEGLETFLERRDAFFRLLAGARDSLKELDDGVRARSVVYFDYTDLQYLFFGKRARGGLNPQELNRCTRFASLLTGRAFSHPTFKTGLTQNDPGIAYLPANLFCTHEFLENLFTSVDDLPMLDSVLDEETGIREGKMNPLFFAAYSAHANEWLTGKTLRVRIQRAAESFMTGSFKHSGKNPTEGEEATVIYPVVESMTRFLYHVFESQGMGQSEMTEKLAAVKAEIGALYGRYCAYLGRLAAMKDRTKTDDGALQDIGRAFARDVWEQIIAPHLPAHDGLLTGAVRRSAQDWLRHGIEGTLQLSAWDDGRVLDRPGEDHTLGRSEYAIRIDISPSYSFPLSIVCGDAFVKALELAALVAEHDQNCMGIGGKSWLVRDYWRLFEALGFMVELEWEEVFMSRDDLIRRKPWRGPRAQTLLRRLKNHTDPKIEAAVAKHREGVQSS